MAKSINEECGVFGVFNHNDAFELAKLGLVMLQHRGQEGCGIAYSFDNKMDLIKNKGLVSKVFDNLNYPATNAISHVRYATTGANSLENVQPFLIRGYDETFSVCHNGNLTNTNLLKHELEQGGSIFQSTSDSEIVAHFIRKSKGSRIDRLKEAVSKLEGSFAFLVLFNDELYAIRDRNGLRPLCLGQVDDTYIVSSESCAFDVVNAKFVRDINPGEILKVSKDGLESFTFDNTCNKTLCSMEYIYFSRPDSVIDGLNVHKARHLLGEQLAVNDIKADIVIGVPDSGLCAALGYSKASGVPLEFGLIKNKYSGRTFIEPTDHLRVQGVKLKLAVVNEVVKDKIVIVVDDSIVRGNTSKQIISLLKNAGAKEVHLRIAASQFKYPCFYGVDFSTYDELISNRYNPEQLASYVGANSIKFLTEEDLTNCLGNNLCLACFNGEYPTKTYQDLDDINKEVK